MQLNSTLTYSKIALHVKNPDLDYVWLEGFDAGQQLHDESINPYQDDLLASDYWSQGWWAGFFQEPALFDAPRESVTPKTSTFGGSTDNLWHSQTAPSNTLSATSKSIPTI